MEIKAYKADDGNLYENEKDCQMHNTEIKLKAWLKEGKTYSSMYDVYEDIIIRRIAEKIINNKQSFNEIFEQLMKI